jgi:hypothetical protein
MQLDATRQHVTHGTIAGVVPTTDMSDAIRQFTGAIDPSLCTGATIASVITQIEQASDILADGTQDPAQSCSGISIGLSFNAERVQLGAVGSAITDPRPCP